jgi:hypothetical protein
MGALYWFGDNWFTLLQSIGIIAGLFFTAHALREDSKERRVSNLMEITKNHREIWTELYSRPELSRVLEANADLKHAPITRQEDVFVRLLILHLNSVYHAWKDGVLSNLEGLPKDIQWFFSLPLPQKIWEKIKPLQDATFVRYVESCIAEH